MGQRTQYDYTRGPWRVSFPTILCLIELLIDCSHRLCVCVKEPNHYLSNTLNFVHFVSYSNLFARLFFRQEKKRKKQKKCWQEIAAKKETQSQAAAITAALVHSICQLN
jgi:hypothetical protein